jgi:hypothetical protein
VIVEEGDQDRLAPAHLRAVHGVADPAGVGPVGLEPAEHRLAARPASGQRAEYRGDLRVVGEVALQGPLPG